MCVQFYFNLGCLKYFNFNSACISIIQISILTVELKQGCVAIFIYNLMII